MTITSLDFAEIAIAEINRLFARCSIKTWVKWRNRTW